MNRVTVVVGTREQEPYTFESGCTEVVRRALPAGDYSVEGHEDSVAVERKTLEDFVSTVLRSRKRFARELRRLCEYDAARWIEEHPKEYAEGVFRGFVVDPQGGKP